MAIGKMEYIIKKEIDKVMKKYNHWLRKNYKEEWKKLLNTK